MEVERAGPSDTSSLRYVLAGAVTAVLSGFALLLFSDREMALSVIHGVAALCTTPFFMEGGLIVFGLAGVVAYNHWRRKQDGEEWVYLAEDDPPSRDGQAVGRHDAVLPVPPSDKEWELEWITLEGLLDLGATAEAGERLLRMPPAFLEQRRSLELRAKLAEATGHRAEAGVLRKRLASPEVR